MTAPKHVAAVGLHCGPSGRVVQPGESVDGLLTDDVLEACLERGEVVTHAEYAKTHKTD